MMSVVDTVVGEVFCFEVNVPIWPMFCFDCVLPGYVYSISCNEGTALIKKPQM